MNCPNCAVECILKDIKNVIWFFCPKCEFKTGANHLKINQMWVFVSVDKDDNEGVVAFRGPGNSVMPMVAADKDRLNSLIEIAKAMALSNGIKIRLLNFCQKTIVQEWG